MRLYLHNKFIISYMLHNGLWNMKLFYPIQIMKCTFTFRHVHTLFMYYLGNNINHSMSTKIKDKDA